MTALAFWLLWLTVTPYLYQQWQRYEPTPVLIDGAAALVGFPLALVVALALM